MKDACVYESCNTCSPSEEEEEEEEEEEGEGEFGCLATFWFGTFVMLLCATRCVVQC